MESDPDVGLCTMTEAQDHLGGQPLKAAHTRLPCAPWSSLILAVLFACSGPASPAPTDASSQDVAPEDASPPAKDIDSEDGGDALTPSGFDGEDGEVATAVGPMVLPQAVGGALQVNPTLFPNPTLVVDVESAISVDVMLADATTSASQDPESGMWVAILELAGTPTGDHDLEVVARGAGGDETTGTWSLRVAEHGIAHTIYEEVGAARTPCLHRGDDSLWVTWTDNRDDPRRLYAQALDGAGRPLAEPIPLTPPDVDIRYGRTSFDGSRFGVLYQTGGGIYENRFLLLETDGTIVAGPVTLDEDGWSTTADGWLTFDGEAFVGVYRNYTPEDSSIFWFRADPQTGELTGPLPIADAGDEDPIGGFTLPSFVRVAGKDGVSMVTFTRDVYDGLFDMMIPQGWVVTLSGDGAILADGGLPVPLTWPFAYEAHAWVVGDAFVPVWTANSLMDEELNPPHRIFGALVQDPATDPGAYDAKLWLNAPRMRGEMALIPHPKHLGVMAWSDERTDVGIYLHVGPVDAEEGISQDLLIPEARFLAMNAHLNGVPLGTNSLIVWLDDRKGGTVGNPMSEVTLETLWF